MSSADEGGGVLEIDVEQIEGEEVSEEIIKKRHQVLGAGKSEAEADTAQLIQEPQGEDGTVGVIPLETREGMREETERQVDTAPSIKETQGEEKKTAGVTPEDRVIRAWWKNYDKDRNSWHAFALTALIFAKERHEGMTQKEIAEWYGSFSEDPAKSEIALPQEEFRKKISSAIGNVLHGNIRLPKNLYLEEMESSGPTKYRLRVKPSIE